MSDPLDPDRTEEIIRDLVREELDLTRAHIDLVQAEISLQVAESRFVAARQRAEVYLGLSPFSREAVRRFWPTALWGVDRVGTDDPDGLDGGLTEGSDIPPYERERFAPYRFVGKRLGEAVVEVLQESGKPLTREELTAELVSGGAEPTPRGLHAALIHLSGIRKLDDGTYEAAGEFGPW